MEEKGQKEMNDTIKVVLEEGAKMPTKAHPEDAGWDIYAREDFTVYSKEANSIYIIDLNNKVIETTGGSATHDTGVHIEIPKGYVGFIKSKSGLNVRCGLTCEGVIDSGYTGSIVVKLYNSSREDHFFQKGDKIAQLVILPIDTRELELADSITGSERGDKGFGSSGR